MENGNYTQRVADFCATIRVTDIPSRIRERTKHIMLDGFGCGLYCAHLPWTKTLADTIGSFGYGGPTVIWGTDRRMAPDHAVLVNGSSVQGFEIDDGNPQSALHSCSLVLPAVLACTDLLERPVAGADLLTAVIVGFEVGSRLGLCLGASQLLERGWHSGSVIGTHAAAAASGRVMGLSPEQMVHAFGIAGTQSSGLMSAQFGSMVKRMNHGRASQSGFYAAALARNGYTGIERVFEERYGGFCTTFTGSEDRFDLNRLTDGLGNEFGIDRIQIKPYACNASIHPSLDAIRAIKARRPFTGADVRSITVRCTKSVLEHVGFYYEPVGMTAAQLNLSFSIALMIEHNDAFVDDYTEETIHSPNLIDLAHKVTAVHDPVLDTLGPRKRLTSILTVDFADGSSETETVEEARGSQGNPFFNDEIIAKYRRLASVALRPEQVDELQALILHLDELDDCRMISKALSTLN